VHGDLCGTISPVMPRSNKYFLLFLDDLSRYIWVAIIPSKDHASATIKDIQVQTKGESDLKLKALHTDCGGELTATEFTDYCVVEGVHHQHTTPYIPQQNGIIEHRNGMVVATDRSMLKAKGLPRWFWGEVVNSTVYVLNMCLTKSIDGMTPFEMCTGGSRGCTTSGRSGASCMCGTRCHT
jgi:transposase InsO family protein